MIVLVNEIEKEILFEIRKHFVEENEITFLEYSENEKQTEFCKKPYYIEENITNLQKVIDLCIAVDNGKSPLRKLFNWEQIGQFACFYNLIISIYKQREVGKKVDDIEFLYLKNKDKYDLEIKTIKYDDDLHICLCGNSKIGQMELYKDFELFVFAVGYKKLTIFKKEKIVHTHWHPWNIFEAQSDLDLFMTDDIDKKLPISKNVVFGYCGQDIVEEINKIVNGKMIYQNGGGITISYHNDFVIEYLVQSMYINNEFYYDIEEQDISDFIREINNDKYVFIQYKHKHLQIYNLFDLGKRMKFMLVNKKKFNPAKIKHKKDVEKVFDIHGLIDIKR